MDVFEMDALIIKSLMSGIYTTGMQTVGWVEVGNLAMRSESEYYTFEGWLRVHWEEKSEISENVTIRRILLLW